MKRKFITSGKDSSGFDTVETILAFASYELGGSNFQASYKKDTYKEYA